MPRAVWVMRSSPQPAEDRAVCRSTSSPEPRYTPSTGGIRGAMRICLMIVRPTITMLTRFAMLLSAVFAGGGGTAQTRSEPSLPAFTTYPAQYRLTGVPSAPLLGSAPYGRLYRTRLRAGAKEGPNFAGVFTVVTWGCGSPCQETVVIDARSGRLSHHVIRTSNGVLFDVSSRLLIADPPKPEDPPVCVVCGTPAAYEWTGSSFSPVGPGPHPHLQNAIE